MDLASYISCSKLNPGEKRLGCGLRCRCGNEGHLEAHQLVLAFVATCEAHLRSPTFWENQGLHLTGGITSTDRFPDGAAPSVVYRLIY